MGDEIPPFAPPSGGLLSPPQQAAPSRFGPPPQLAPAAAAAPPTSYLPPLPPPPLPPRRRLSRASVTGIVAGSAAILLIVGGAFAASALIVQSMGPASAADSAGNSSSGTPVPHPGGVTSATIAPQPLHCTATCFANDILVPGDTVPPPSSITGLGLTKTIDSLGDYSSSTASDEYDQTLTGWKDAKATPPECFFTYFQSPVVATLGDRPSRDITDIYYSGTHSDPAKDNVLTQSVRIFADSADAETYMRQLDAGVRGCPSYRTSDSSGSVDVEVAPARAFSDFPSSVAAVGWVELSSGGRYETIDLQRGNVVVRTSLQSFDDGVTQSQFRSFVDDDAWQIAAMLTPGDGH